MDIEAACTGLATGTIPEPCIVVIFGITGDLARHDLVPSLYALQAQKLLPEKFAVVGFARRDLSEAQLRDDMREFVASEKHFDANLWQNFAAQLHYVRGDFNAPVDEAYTDLAKKITQLQKEQHLPRNLLIHLSTPPSFYDDIMQRLSQTKLLDQDSGWKRVIVEKPFGHDEATARELDQQLLGVIEEQHLYRVDHFLGKETVQNMLAFRFANPSYEPIWNHHYIDHVQITAAESEGIGTRGNFYEQTGVVRDMLQNHLLQLLCMTCMEPPVSYDGNALRDETVKVLRAIRSVDVQDECVLAQYRDGTVNGKPAVGYQNEDDVTKDSKVPTFTAVKLHVDNWRWAGVPFYVRTGKRLKRKLTSISIHFKPTPHFMFPVDHRDTLQANTLTFRLQPDEAILHTFLAKQPGPDICLQPVTMRFRYDRTFGIEKMPGAYQWLLLDAMQGDQTLFPRSDWIYKAWSIVDPLVKHAEENASIVVEHEAGTWGPKQAKQLIERDGRAWSNP